ncbi:hypothetical protein BDF20DRAFT_914910 [Mycotypha africana]|uniref:uncharacterized protein n=1 Tax=Mycotypha africana TaxID=64632 RepID=UPI002300B851|nr:uncharacterized protein BDF20DRAFT_914910 [Mycotypha africana]KAI8973470.1 hypothetical protein BDF20DRAFT_914910 [Mycotypha africana]
MIDFTPKQLHYFKRELITEELEKEIQYLLKADHKTISNLIIDSTSTSGDQETAKNDNNDSAFNDRIPFLKYIFDNIIIEFPLLKHTRDDQFWPKCKLLLNEFNKLQLESFYTSKRSEGNLQRRSMQQKIQKSLVFAFCASIKTTQGAEESIRINAETIAAKSKSTTVRSTDGDNVNMNSTVTNTTTDILLQQQRTLNGKTQLFKVNILTVREKKRKKALRDAAHAEFLIETWFPDQPNEPVYVARRHGDFRRLRDQLKQHFNKQHHHQYHLPLVPPKSDETSRESFYKENDRLALRNFLIKLTGCENHLTQQQQQIRKSRILRKFLSNNPIVFTLEEEQDALQREEKDKKKIVEEEMYQKELDARVHELNQTLETLKKDILKPGGLIKVFDTIKATKSVQDLPYSLYKAFEWGRISFAFALHKQFISSDAATENLTNLRRTHTLMPYKTISFILKFSNPMSMVKGILDLFLAQPFGGRSLFQRMIISNLNEESKAFEKEIKHLETKINNPLFCEKLRNAVKTPIPPTDTTFRELSGRASEILSLLSNNDIKPCIPIEQLKPFEMVNNNYPSEAVPIDNEKRKLLKQMAQLWELYTRQHEQELLMTLVFQGVTGELLKEFISVFYQPLAQVYKAADISTTIRHVASFIDDLLKTVDGLKQQQQSNNNTSNTNDNVANTIQLFIDLVQRHEQRFYEFIHNVHTQEASNVFDELIQYLDRLFTFVAKGIPGKLDFNTCLEQAGISLTTASSKEEELLKEEVNAICNYRYQQKMHHFERQRRKLNHATPEGLQTVAEEMNRQRQKEVFQFIPKTTEMMNALDDFEEFQYEDEGEISNSSRRTSDASNGTTGTHGSSDFDLLASDDESAISSSSNGSSSSGDSSSSLGSSGLSYEGLDKPKLQLIPKILPFFVKGVTDLMRKQYL